MVLDLLKRSESAQPLTDVEHDTNFTNIENEVNAKLDASAVSTFGATLIDDLDAAAARTTLGVDVAGTDNSTDVTLAASLTDVLGLTGQALSAVDPGTGDRVPFWDDSATKLTWLTLGTNLSITGTTLDAAATDLSYTASTRLLSSSTGTDVTLPEVVVDGNSGLMTGAQATRLADIGAAIIDDGQPVYNDITDNDGFFIQKFTGSELEFALATRSTAALSIFNFLVGSGDLKTVATTGDYSDLTNQPTLGNAASLDVGTIAGTVAAGDDSRFSDARTPTSHAATHATGQADAIAPADIGAATSAQGALADSAVQPGDLSTVATTGAYSDLSGVPFISAFGASLIDDANAGAARTTLGVDVAGTDNSTDVTLASNADAVLGLSGQALSFLDPGQRRLLGWLDSTGEAAWFDIKEYIGNDTNSLIIPTAAPASGDRIYFYQDSSGHMASTTPGDLASFLIGNGLNTDLAYTASTRLLTSSTGADVTFPEVVVGGNSGLMTGAQATKLDGIEASADVTDQTNVVAALSGATVTGMVLGSTTESVFAISDADGYSLDPDDGPIQTVTLGANRTYVLDANFTAGKSMLLSVTAAGNTLAITGVDWGDDGAPTLGTVTEIQLWNIGGTVRAAEVWTDTV